MRHGALVGMLLLLLLLLVLGLGLRLYIGHVEWVGDR